MKNKLGQTVTAFIQMENGQPFLINTYVAGLIRSQDLEAWKANPEGLDAWLKAQIANMLSRCTTVIQTRN